MNYKDLGDEKYDAGLYEEAIEIYSEGIEQFPKDDELYYSRALAYEKLEMDEEAIIDLDKAINLSDTDEWYCYRRALIKYYLERNLEALVDIERAIQLRPLQASFYVLKGDIRKEMEQYPEAVEDYKKAIELDPEYAAAYVSLADIKYELEQHEEALKLYDKALELDPEYAYAVYSKGYVYKELQEFGKAAKCFSEAIKIKPEKTEYYYKRAYANKKAGLTGAAIRDYGKIIKITPGDPDAYILRGDIYLSKGKYEKALSDYNTAYVLQETHTEYFFNARGYVKYHLGDIDGAFQDYNLSLEVNPCFVSALLNKSRILCDRNQYKEAIKYCDIALHIDNRECDAYNLKGFAEDKLGETENAIREYETILKLKPDDNSAKESLEQVKGKLAKNTQSQNNQDQNKPASYNDLVQIFSKKSEKTEEPEKKPEPVKIAVAVKERQETSEKTKALNAYLASAAACLRNGQEHYAIEYCRKAIRIDINSEVAFNRLGVAYYMLGHYSEALTNYRHAIELNPNYAAVYCNIGVLEERQGDRNSAICYYNKALEVDSSCYQAREYLNNLQTHSYEHCRGGDYEDR